MMQSSQGGMSYGDDGKGVAMATDSELRLRLLAADYLIRAADTSDQGERDRLTGLATALIRRADEVSKSEAEPMQVEALSPQ